MANLKHVYGPVPSKRLGRSLGIDLVPFKTCTYDCVYCQLGRTTNKTLDRREYMPVDEIMAELDSRLAAGASPDYISLAGSGEPTLNSGIGALAEKIKRLTDIPLAVITNGSLLWRREVQDALMAADLVIPSLDAGDDRLFRRVNRPHPDLSFKQMVNGLAEFANRFDGEIWLEVFLLDELTGIPAEAEKIAGHVRRIGPTRVQLNTVSRPPAEDSARAVALERISGLKRYFPGVVDVIGETGPAKACNAEFFVPREDEILALLARRPCRAEDVALGLGIQVTEAVKHLDALIQVGKITVMAMNGSHFFYRDGFGKIAWGM